MIDFVINDVKYSAKAIEKLIEKNRPRKIQNNCCPKCNTRFLYSIFMDQLGFPQTELKDEYCSKCGQRLDWSE